MSVQVSEQVLLDVNGNRTRYYQDQLLELAAQQQDQHKIFVEVGVGVGMCLCGASRTFLNVIGVDLFQRRAIVNQLEECQHNIEQVAGIIPTLIVSPGEFPAKGFCKKQIDVLHLDILDNEEIQGAAQAIRWMANVWRPKTRTIITPNTTLYRSVMSETFTPGGENDAVCAWTNS